MFSVKLAEEITLTIGQAFELAYKRFLETFGKIFRDTKKGHADPTEDQTSRIRKQRM